jgi:hypothetical protein
MTTAARSLRYRQRQRQPVRAVYRAEVDRDRFLGALVRSGWLEAANTQQRDQVEMALSLMLAAWVEEAEEA